MFPQRHNDRLPDPPSHEFEGGIEGGGGPVDAELVSEEDLCFCFVGDEVVYESVEGVGEVRDCGGGVEDCGDSCDVGYCEGFFDCFEGDFELADEEGGGADEGGQGVYFRVVEGVVCIVGREDDAVLAVAVFHLKSGLAKQTTGRKVGIR